MSLALRTVPSLGSRVTGSREDRAHFACVGVRRPRLVAHPLASADRMMSVRVPRASPAPKRGGGVHMAIAITHPGAGLLAPALDTLADVVAGDWTSAAHLCAARLKDPYACALDL